MAASTPTTAGSVGIERGVEQELAPGIYFTPAPKACSAPVGSGGVGRSSNSANGEGIPAAPAVEKMTREELEWEYRSIGKTISKLRESNQLMGEFLENNSNNNNMDSVLVEAISENDAIIARRSLRLALVKERLDFLIRAMPHIKPCRPDQLKNKVAASILQGAAPSSAAAATGDDAVNTSEEAAADSGLAGLQINDGNGEEQGSATAAAITTNTDTTPGESEPALGMDL